MLQMPNKNVPVSKPIPEYKMYVYVYMYMCYSVQFFNLILDSWDGFSAGIQSPWDSVPESLGPNPAFSWGRQLVAFRFKNRLTMPEHRNEQQQTCMYVCICIYVCIYVPMYVTKRLRIENILVENGIQL